jgi:hypothetical protein
MRDLEKKTGMSRSTIQYYIKEGLLPAPERPTGNSAIYSDIHVALIGELEKLRAPPLGPLPLPLKKRIATRLREGLSLEMALSLEKALAGASFDPQILGERHSLSSACKVSGVSRKLLNSLLEVGAVVADPIDGKLDAMDLEMIGIYKRLFDVTRLSPDDTRPITERIRAESRYEMSLRNRSITGKNADEASRITLLMEQSIHAIRNYLYYRARIVELADGEKG